MSATGYSKGKQIYTLGCPKQITIKKNKTAFGVLRPHFIQTEHTSSSEDKSVYSVSGKSILSASTSFERGSVLVLHVTF